MFVDAHCHIYKEYFDDIDLILKESLEKKVCYFINNGCSAKTNKEVLELVNNYENMFGTLGIHPEYVDEYKDEDLLFIEKNINNKKIIAIGEIGLDYHYTKENKENQIILFEKQLKIAQKYNLPVIIHSRDATLDTINILKKYKLRGLIHSFSGSIETAREYIKLGYFIGVNGVVTFKNSNIKYVVEKIPLNKLLLETDSPYLTPEPFRGKQNNPSHIIEIANFVANLKQISLEELSKITVNNIKELFKVSID